MNNKNTYINSTKRSNNKDDKQQIKYLSLTEEALHYHSMPPAGKTSILPTKPLVSQHNLSLAYSPGVGAVSDAIFKDEKKIYDYTNVGNLLAIISNGTAVLGLGNIGPKASKPVMEGKAVLLKKFANIDCYDLEINAHDVDTFVQAVVPLEPGFGGIILEDVKAPECFIIEKEIKKRMNIPVFHDDQHGTAVVVGAALLNAVDITHRDIASMKIVVVGAGAAAIACLHFILYLGAKKENIYLFDSHGLITTDRKDLPEYKQDFARDSDPITLQESLKNADMFLGLAKGNLLTPDMVYGMNKSPIIFALSNPIPEILPETLTDIDKDAIICTGRSDYPNQVNNVLCFPFLFRGALDVRANAITPHMMEAASRAIADLAKQPIDMMGEQIPSNLTFSKDYIIPFPFDTRLMPEVATAVAQAAMNDNVAQISVNIEQYKKELEYIAGKNRPIFRPLYLKIVHKKEKKRLIFCDGENREVINTVGRLIDDHLAYPILIGRKNVIKIRMEQQSLNLDINDVKKISICDPESDSRYEEYWRCYFQKMQRKGINKSLARLALQSNHTVIGAMLLEQHEGDALLTGVEGSYLQQLNMLQDVFSDMDVLSTGAILKLPQRTLFIANPVATIDECNVNAEYLGQSAIQLANLAKYLGFKPSVALLSNSNFGSNPTYYTQLMQDTLIYLKQQLPDFIFDGEMDLDLALSPELDVEYLTQPILHHSANVLVFPSVLASHFMIKAIMAFVPGTELISPILLGYKHQVQIANIYSKRKDILNLSIYLASLDV